jgi:hypothetical protein
MMRRTIALGFAVPLTLLAACGRDDARAPREGEAEASAATLDIPQRPTAQTGAAEVDSASARRLQPLQQVDFATAIPPGLGCSFSTGGDDGLLVVAAAGSPAAVVRLNGHVVRLDAMQPGHDYLEAGPTLRTEQWEIRIVRARGEGQQIGMEAMGWPAGLILTRRGEGEADRRQGEWSCGA